MSQQELVGTENPSGQLFHEFPVTDPRTGQTGKVTLFPETGKARVEWEGLDAVEFAIARLPSNPPTFLLVNGLDMDDTRVQVLVNVLAQTGHFQLARGG